MFSLRLHSLAFLKAFSHHFMEINLLEGPDYGHFVIYVMIEKSERKGKMNKKAQRLAGIEPKTSQLEAIVVPLRHNHTVFIFPQICTSKLLLDNSYSFQKYWLLMNKVFNISLFITREKNCKLLLMSPGK